MRQGSRMTLYQTFRGASLVFRALQNARHHAVADQFPDRRRPRSARSCWRRDCRARPQAPGRLGRAARDLRIFAARKSGCSIRWKRGFRPGMRARRAGRHRRAGRTDRPGSFGRARHPGGRRRGRSHDRRRGARPSISEARIVFSGGSANLISDDAQGGRLRRRGVRKPRHRQNAVDDGAAFAQHPGERRILQGDGGAEAAASAGCW